MLCNNYNYYYSNIYYKVLHTARIFSIALAVTLIASSFPSSPGDDHCRPFILAESRSTSESFRRLLSDFTSPATALGSADEEETKWAVLVAGSEGYKNYRHQADVCHAYQILKQGGLRDENIVVLMYDDIAFNEQNPKKGVIINRPGGEDVYAGVPKDYTGASVTAKNVISVILGEEDGVEGGSGKVVKSGPNDHIFIYYSDHGGPGVLSMPDEDDDLYAKDFIDTLTKKHASGTYKSMVIYIEACEAGSIFDGLLPTGMNIYATTASNPTESSYATYCPTDDPTVPTEYQTCLGDLYSVAWMEDGEQNREESLENQYETVKVRTIQAAEGSHVMQYGDSNMGTETVSLYIGSTMNNNADDLDATETGEKSTPYPLVAVEQREADILYFQHKVRRAPPGSQQKVEAQKKLDEAIAHREHVDRSIAKIGKLLFGAEQGREIIKTVRPVGQPLVDDWDCLKALVGVYKTHCGTLSSYGMKYMRAFSNMCNAGIRKDQMAQASSRACTPKKKLK